MSQFEEIPSPGRGRLAACKTLGSLGPRGEREGYGGPRDVTSLSLSLASL